jgi:hypothetical protein
VHRDRNGQRDCGPAHAQEYERERIRRPPL